MGRYVARRLLQAIPVFIGTTFIIFALVYALPGDPIRALSGDKPISPSVYAELQDRYNLDDPLLVQYGKYMLGLLQGDFGQSFRGREVSEIMSERIPVTLKLAAVAFAFEILVGITAGVLAGLRRGSFIDNLVLISTTLVVSIPVFVLGFTAQIVLGVQLGWFPIAGTSQGWYSYLLPGMVLGAISLAYVARLTRTSLVENMRADYVRTATAKGLPRSRVVGRHALRNSLIPVITYLGIDLGALMGGAIITEGIFNLPGIGQQVFLSIKAQEGPVVVGIVTALVLVFIFANLIVDLLYAVLDPRIRYE
ncbi:MAG TPA: ABC transporter permease [Aeromicrobium sp.]|jgi:oligopeptide transport system permease protein|nr:ABC transporter permease [Nocardioidaceae bacterium]HJR90159.1 ABC transporter permease [Aeromicrobium sp.]